MKNKKILYVEDDLFNNISTIKILFKSFLTKEVLDDLENLRKSGGDGLAISNNEIKEVLDKSSLIEVEYSFLSALNKIENTPENYSLFIIDRDLSEKVDNISYRKELDVIKNKNIGYKKKYDKRGGDFLFLILFLNTNINLLDSFYFLTANSKSDFVFNNTIEAVALSKKNFDFKLFKERNIVAKDKNEKKLELARNIEKYQKNYRYIIKNEKYLKVFKDYNIDDSLFLQILKEHDKIDSNNYTDKINEEFFRSLLLIDENGELENIENVNRIAYNLLLIRKVLVDLLEKLAGIIKNKPELKAFIMKAWIKEKDFGYYHDNGNLKVGKFLQIVSRYYPPDKNMVFNNSLLSNDMIYYFLNSLWNISSAFGAHDSEGYQPTLDTVNSLIYQLKEIILWFGKVMEGLDKK